MDDNVDPKAAAQQALQVTLEDTTRTMRQFVAVMGEHSRVTKEDITAQTELNTKLVETSENAIIEGDYISKLSKADLERHKKDLESTIQLIKSDKDGTKQLLNSIKNRTEYELKMRSVETEKKKAEDQGFMAMHTARFHEMQLKTGQFAQQYLGASSGMTKAVGKNLGVITTLAIAVMGLLYSFKKAGSVIKETNQGLLLSGGSQGRDWNSLTGNGAQLQSVMQKNGQDIFTAVEMLDMYNQSIENGAMSLARSTLAQENKMNMDEVNQSEMQSLTMSSAIQMKQMGMAIFGNNDMLPEIYKTATMYNLNIRTETQDMLGFVANTSIELGVHTSSMMSIISSLGEKIYMTGQGIVPTEYALSKLGNTLKNTEGMTANYIQSIMEMAGKQAASFDTLKYMAVMPNRTGDVGKDFAASLRIDPITQMQTYFQTLGKKIGGNNAAEKMAFAMPEFRSGPGLAFMKTMLTTSLTGKESLSEMQKKLRTKNDGTNDEYTNMGAAIIKGGDVPHAILLYVQNISDSVATLVSTVLTLVPGIKNPALRKAIQNAKNSMIESRNLPSGNIAKRMASL